MRRTALITLTFLIVFLCPAHAFSMERQEEADLNDERHERGGFRFFGEAALYLEYLDYDQNTFDDDGEDREVEDAQKTVPYFKVELDSPAFKGLAVGAGVTGNYYLHIRGDETPYDDDRGEVMLHRIYLAYELGDTTFMAGRYEIEDALILDDLSEAASIDFRQIEDVRLLLSVTHKYGKADGEDIEEFVPVNEEEDETGNLLYGAELSWLLPGGAISGSLLYYHQERLFDLYGAGMYVSAGPEEYPMGTILEGYLTDEDPEYGMMDEDDEPGDGSIFHAAAYVGAQGLKFSAGYLKAGSEVGAREGGPVDDYINPFIEGENVYAPGAETWYGRVQYENERLDIEVVGGTTEYLDDGGRTTEWELGVAAEYMISENIALECELTRYVTEEEFEGYNMAAFWLEYEFESIFAPAAPGAPDGPGHTD